jgi:hypothetical protein
MPRHFPLPTQPITALASILPSLASIPPILCDVPQKGTLPFALSFAVALATHIVTLSATLQ